MSGLGRELAKLIVRPVRGYLEAHIGPVRQWVRTRRERRARRTVQDALDIMERRWKISSRSPQPVGPGPVFLLAAGWRSGSTMAQRLICSAEEILLWGEPYDHCDLIRQLATSLTVIHAEYPPEHFLAASKLGDSRSGNRPLWDDWIANLYPEPRYLLQAHRAFLNSLFGEPAFSLGYRRWGVKEVRLGIDHAAYLRWVFPNARFVFLYRNPYDAYRSFRPCRGWYDRFPDRPVLTPRQFGIHWRNLCDGYVRGHQLVGGLLISYERLIQDQTCLAELAQYLEVSLDEEVLRRKVGSTRDTQTDSVPAHETRSLQRAVEPLASALGYAPAPR